MIETSMQMPRVRRVPRLVARLESPEVSARARHPGGCAAQSEGASENSPVNNSLNLRLDFTRLTFCHVRSFSKRVRLFRIQRRPANRAPGK